MTELVRLNGDLATHSSVYVIWLLGNAFFKDMMHFLKVMIMHLFITSYDLNGPAFKDRLCNLGDWQ